MRLLCIDDPYGSPTPIQTLEEVKHDIDHAFVIAGAFTSCTSLIY